MTGRVYRSRETLDLPQDVYDSQAHLEVVIKAYRSGVSWQIERAVAAAESHLRASGVWR